MKKTKKKVMQRVFRYSSIELADPGTDKSIEEVKDFYAAHYPDLINSTAKGPTIEGDKEVWKFEPVKGLKG